VSTPHRLAFIDAVKGVDMFDRVQASPTALSSKYSCSPLKIAALS
jgi:hypothetical protein